ncbi:MAG TPA: ABC transporter ATP-binding protein [Gemmatimonas sp.]|uniref:ABC transporter ATP-binding protein n=1 Tax=Gemmatimonas sp. TaxID=1962908 RepID=UPI002EDAE08F
MIFHLTTPLVSVRGLSKRFDGHAVLTELSLDLHRGAITAIVGPNGAGKTTLNKAILGLVRPDAGTILFDGRDTAGRIDHRASIGYMPQLARYPETFTGRDVLSLLSELRGKGLARDETLVQAFALERFLDQPARALSGGQRQRINAAAAFLFSPQLLLLDEPTAGLDPVASGILKRAIRGARNAGCAVVITSHILSELQELADTIVFLHEGRIGWQGAVLDLFNATGASTLEEAIAQLMQHGTLVDRGSASA